jgi:hypothetical protein
MFYIGTKIEHWYYGKGTIIEIYSSTIKVKFDKSTDGLEYKELKYNEVSKLFW